MPLSDSDLSATPIDDGSLIPETSSEDPKDRSLAPNSPQARLVLFDARSGESETIDLSSASSVMTLEDYKKLNAQTTQRGMITGLAGGGVITYLVKRFKPTTPSRNALALTFFLSSSFISFSSSRAFLVSSILEIRNKARAEAMANGEMQDPTQPRSDAIFDAPGLGSGDSPTSLPSFEGSNYSSGYGLGPGARGTGPGPRGRVTDELAKIEGRVPQGTRYAKGRGLEGEVEGEGEMRDPYDVPSRRNL